MLLNFRKIFLNDKKKKIYPIARILMYTGNVTRHNHTVIFMVNFKTVPIFAYISNIFHQSLTADKKRSSLKTNALDNENTIQIYLKRKKNGSIISHLVFPFSIIFPLFEFNLLLSFLIEKFLFLPRLQAVESSYLSQLFV